MTNRKARLCGLSLAVILQSACSTGLTPIDELTPQQASQEQVIPFANQGGIRNWRPVDDASLLIEDRHGQWYLARLQSASGDLAFAEGLAFLTEPGGAFGRLGAVLIKGVRYPVISLVKVPPPSK